MHNVWLWRFFVAGVFMYLLCKIIHSVYLTPKDKD